MVSRIFNETIQLLGIPHDYGALDPIPSLWAGRDPCWRSKTIRTGRSHRDGTSSPPGFLLPFGNLTLLLKKWLTWSINKCIYIYKYIYIIIYIHIITHISYIYIYDIYIYYLFNMVIFNSYINDDGTSNIKAGWKMEDFSPGPGRRRSAKRSLAGTRYRTQLIRLGSATTDHSWWSLVLFLVSWTPNSLVQHIYCAMNL